MVSDADASFRELFGDEFARAYEEQLERLKAQGRSGKRSTLRTMALRRRRHASCGRWLRRCG